MPNDIFLMDNGADYHTRLWRVRVMGYWRWRDAPAGKWQLEFDDEDGHPVDVFGLPLDGEFVEASIKNC